MSGARTAMVEVDEPALGVPSEERPCDPRGRWIAIALLLAFALALFNTQLVLMPGEPHSLAFHDELHYAQQARDIAAGHIPRWNRAFEAFVPPMYGLALAPARYFSSREGWAWWGRVVNTLLLVSAVVPVFCLARRFLKPGLAALTAALAVVSPFQVYARYLLSESLFIPLFLWLALVVVRACERPTLVRAAQVGLFLGLAYLTKPLVVGSAPAVFLAIFWALRSVRKTALVSLWIVAAGALVVAPWRFRAWIFPSERDLLAIFSYSDSLTSAGLHSVSWYLEWIGKTAGCFLIGLGFAVLALGTTGLLTEARSEARARRGFAAFTILSALGTLALVGFATAQWAPDQAKLHERYFVCFWPLFLIAFVTELQAGRLSRKTLAAVSALVLVMLVWLPRDFFDPETRLVNSVDFPTSVLWWQIQEIAGSAVAVRWLYLLAASPLLLFVWKPRWAAPLLLALTAVYQGWGAWAALERADGTNVAAEHLFRPVWDWLDGVVHEGDVVIHHHLPPELWKLSYHDALRYEMDYCAIEDDLVPTFNSAMELDTATGLYRFTGIPPTGDVWLMTGAASEVAAPGELRLDGLRLIPLPNGLSALGPWLGDAASPSITGRADDGTCGRSVRIELAGPYPSTAELAASVSLPEGWPAGRSVSVALRRDGELVAEEALHPAMSWAFYLAETLWSPRLAVTLDADRDSLIDGQNVAFRMSEPAMTFGALSPAGSAASAPEPSWSGIHPDLWCERTVRVRFPRWPEVVRFPVELYHPSDSPLAGPVAITLRVNEHEVTTIELAPGESHKLVFTAKSDLPWLDFVLEADRDAPLDGRRVAFRLGRP